MQRNRKPAPGKPTPARNTNNEYLGFLGGQEASKQISRRQQRLQKFKNANPTPPLNTGVNATMMNVNQDADSDPTPVKVQPGNLSQSISLPADIQEKINKWRETRQQKEKQNASRQPSTGVGQYTDAKGNSFFSNGSENSESDEVRNIKPKVVDVNRAPTIQHVSQSPPPSKTQPQVSHDSTNVSLNHPRQQVRPVITTTDQPPVLSALPFSQSGNYAPPSSSIIQASFPVSSISSTTSISPTTPALSQPSSNIFDASNQEIMRGQVEFEVKRVLDQLKKERPELVNQAEVMNIVNQKTRKFEESLQQFNVREQRLRDLVDQMNVTIKAVQSNVDHTKTENGGQFLTEEVMRSWVSFFFGEQIAAVKNELHADMSRTIDKLTSTSTSTQRPTELKTMENNLRLLETKFQNTMQSIFEFVCFAYGTVLEEVALYESPETKSKEIIRCNPNDRLMVLYPILKSGNDRWMKVRTVNPETAQLGDAWVPILLNNVPHVGNFKLV